MGAPAGVGLNGDQIELFVRDSVTGHLLHQESIGHDNSNYPAWNVAGWEDLGGNLAPGKPTVVVSQPGNQLNVFVRDADGTAATIAVHGYGLHGPWVNLSGGTLFEPGAASWGPTRLDVFVAGTNHELYHRYSNDSGATWGPGAGNWEWLGGSVAATPAVTSWGANRLDVVVSSTNATMSHVAWTGNSWGPCGAPPCWSTLLGTTWQDPIDGASAPTMISTGPANLQLFIQGTNRGLYTYSMSGTDALGNPSWTNPLELTSCFATAGAASVVSRDGSTFDVAVTAYAANGDASVWHTATVGGAFTFGGISASSSPPACACGGSDQILCSSAPACISPLQPTSEFGREMCEPVGVGFTIGIEYFNNACGVATTSGTIDVVEEGGPVVFSTNVEVTLPSSSLIASPPYSIGGLPAGTYDVAATLSGFPNLITRVGSLIVAANCP